MIFIKYTKMEGSIKNLIDKIYSNSYDSLLQIIKQLSLLMEESKEKSTIKILDDIIDSLNNITNENKTNLDLMKKNINELCNKSDQLNINNKEIKENKGEYIGQIINGLKNGKGIYYFGNGDRYEGEWKNDRYEGKGIYYFKDGRKYEGDWKNDKKEGKRNCLLF